MLCHDDEENIYARRRGAEASTITIQCDSSKETSLSAVTGREEAKGAPPQGEKEGGEEEDSSRRATGGE